MNSSPHFPDEQLSTQDVLINGLHTKAIGIKLTQTRPALSRVDKNASKRTCEREGTKEGRARTSRVLISSDDLADVRACEQAIYNEHCTRTAKIAGQKGIRLLLSRAYTSYMDEIRPLLDQYDAAVREFARLKYPAIYANAKSDMGDLFNPKDFPHPDEIRTKFKSEVKVVRLASHDHLSLDGVPEEILQRIHEDGKAEERHMAVMAAQDAYKRLSDKLWDTASRLKNYDRNAKGKTNKLFKTMLPQLHAIAEAMDGINIFDDYNIKAVAETIKSRIAHLDLEELKSDDYLRQEKAAEVEQLARTTDRVLEDIGPEDLDDAINSWFPENQEAV